MKAKKGKVVVKAKPSKSIVKSVKTTNGKKPGYKVAKKSKKYSK